MNCRFFNFTICWGLGKLRISETVDTGAQLYFSADPTDFLYTYLLFTDITNRMGSVELGQGNKAGAFSHG
jgi:hypothetical protein